MIAQPRLLVRMPEVIGLPLRKAKLLIENAGLTIDAIKFEESYEARDTILVQKPNRGQMIYPGEKVMLTVSRESYVKWLPLIFQRQDLNGQNFIRDFLWIIQHLFSSIEEILDNIHIYFDPHETPRHFLPWLASWSAMILDEDWPVEKKRRLIKKAIELYRIRGTVKGLKLFISLFTGHEPEIKENVWPFRGWRVGVTSILAVDTVILPPVNLAHTFIVEMPISYKDISPQAVIRIHEIIQMEKPANTQYYLRFAVEEQEAELREFFVIGTSSGIGITETTATTVDSEGGAEGIPGAEIAPSKSVRSGVENDDVFSSRSRNKPPLPKAPKADTAPIEGNEPRSNEAGFGVSAREMQAVAFEEPSSTLPNRESIKEKKTITGKKKDDKEPQ